MPEAERQNESSGQQQPNQDKVFEGEMMPNGIGQRAAGRAEHLQGHRTGKEPQEWNVEGRVKY